jgi:hypothetical protein
MRRESEVPLAPTTYDPDIPETLSEAVLRALDGDPTQRYSAARELSTALRAGLAGRTPPPPTGEAPTGRLADATAPTRLLGDREAPVEPPPVAPPPPRPPRERRARAAPAPRRRSAAGRILRMLALVIVVLVLAGIIAAAVLLLTNAGKTTDISQFLKQNVPDQVKSLFDFINAHTQ